jgi:hypothetical protein
MGAEVLGVLIEAVSEDFEVPPAQMPEAAELLNLTEAGQKKIEAELAPRRFTGE